MLSTQSGGLTTLTWLEQKAQEGDAFIATDYDSAVEIIGPKQYGIIAPNTTKYSHLIIEVSALTAGTFELFETPTITGAGTALTAYNLNRNSSTAATLVVKYDMTTSADGTRIWHGRVQAAASPVSNRVAIELQTSLTYHFKFTTDANSNKLWVQFIWVEHTDLT